MTADLEAAGSADTGARPIQILRLSDNTKCVYVHTVVGDKDTQWLVDTGASPSLMNVNIYNSMSPEVKPPMHQYQAELVAADGHTRMEVHGITELEVLMGGQMYKLSVVLADLGEIEGILGMDFIWEWGFNVNIHDPIPGLKSTMYDREIPIVAQPLERPQCFRVTVKESVIVKPDTEQVLIGHIERRKNALPLDVGEVEPVSSFSENTGLMLSHALVDAENTDVVLTCANFTDEPIKVKKGTNIGLLKPVDKVVSKPQQSELCYQNMEINDLPEHLQDMAQRASLGLNDDQCKQMCGMIYHNKDLFVGPDGKLGLTSIVKHTIDTQNAPPVKRRPYKPALSQRKVIEDEIDRMLKHNIVEPSTSPYASPVVLVTKKDGSPRFCVDYRGLNAQTVKNSWPIPNINDCLDSLAGGKYFSTLDLASGYNQCEVDEADREKTAFICHKGLFQFRVLPFGLCNAPATFEQLMERVLQGLQWERCLVYLDDIISFGSTWEMALFNLQCVFDRLKAANLKMKPKKCTLFQQSVTFLGHKVTPEGICCDEEKIQAVRNWPVPKNVKDIRAFVGFANYYRRFIKSFAHVAAPLTALTKKDRPFQWTDICQEAFETLKLKLTEAPILAYPSCDENSTFILDTDASDWAISGVLSQVQNGVERVIAYASKTLSNSQRKYCTTYKELLAVVTFVKHFRHYLLGVKSVIRTDHNSLKWLMNFKDADGLVGRWIMTLQPFDLEIQHRPGAKHGNADGLSRQQFVTKRRRCGRELCPDCPTGTGTPIGIVNVIQTCSKPNKVVMNDMATQACLDHLESNTDDLDSSTERNEVPEPETAPGSSVQASAYNSMVEGCNWMKTWSVEDLVELQMANPAIAKLLTWKKEGRSCPSRQELLQESSEVKELCGQWRALIVENGLLYRQWTPKSVKTVCLQLIAPQEIKQEIFKQVHVVRSGGHLGVRRTLVKIRQRFFWPHCKADVERWCKECTTCAQVKAGPGYKAPLHQVPVRRKLERVALDVMGELPETRNGNKYILVATNYHTKRTHAMAMPDQPAQIVADIFLTEVE